MFKETTDFNREKLVNGKLYLLSKRTWLSTAILSMPIKVVDTKPGDALHNTACVTDRAVIYMSKFLFDRPDVSPQMIGAIILHEVGHIIRSHRKRSRVVVTPGDEQAAKKWNIVADIELNDDDIIVAHDPECINVANVEKMLSEKLKRKIELKGLLAEEIWALMEEAAEKNGGGGQSQVKGRGAEQGCGSGAGNPMDGEPKDSGSDSGSLPGGEGNRPGNQQGQSGNQQGQSDSGSESGDARDGLSEMEQALISQQTAEAIQAKAAKQPGTIPGSWIRWAEKELSGATIPWQRELSAHIRRAVASASGKLDYSMKKMSRRQSVVPDARLPGMLRPVVEVLTIVDTSGSMGDADVTEMLSEVQGILKAVGQPCWVLSVDAAVHTKQRVTDARRVKVAGGGGTDMRVGVRAGLKLKPRPHVIVILTDGFTPWPSEEECEGVKVIACITKAGSMSGVPAHIRAIQVNS